MTTYTISELHYYPVKSLGGIQASTVRVRRIGFEYDRRWMLVDEKGTFLTQREHPSLATFTVGIEGKELLITAREGSSISVPLEAESHTLVPVTVWNSRLDAFTCGAEADGFFSDALGQNVRLIRIPEAAVRTVDPQYGQRGDHVSFADAYPVLVACTASLDDLNRRAGEHVPMNRFRPNIVITTATPFEEDDWKGITSSTISIRLVKPSDRCVITTTDQATGERYAEPLKTLATFRKRGNAVYFGVNGIPDVEGTLTVGSAVRPST